MSFLAAFIRLSRPYNALLPSIAIVAGYEASEAYASSAMFISIAIFVGLHGLITIWNDFEDESADALNGVRRLADLRQAGKIRHLKIICAVVAILALAGLFFLPLATQLAFAAFIIVGWLYNAAPARLSRRPIGSMIAMAAAYGWLPIIIGASLSINNSDSGINGFVLLLIVAWGLNRLSLSILKDYKDAPGDAKAGKRTFLLCYGSRLTVRVSFGLTVLGLLTVVLALATQRIDGVLAVIAVVASWLVYEHSRLFRMSDYEGPNRVFHDRLQYQLIFDVLVVVWLIMR